MKPCCYLLLIVALAISPLCVAWAYQALLVQQPPTTQIEEALEEGVSLQAIAITDEEEREMCCFWFRQSIPTLEGAESAADLLLPMVRPGTFLGFAKYFQVGEACYEQPIPKELYTIRYMRIPQDGNHIGAFPTRDFLLLLPVDRDTTTTPRPPESLLDIARSIDLHPYTLPLIKPASKKYPSLPVIQPDEENRPTLFLRWTFQNADGETVQKTTIGFIPGFGLTEALGVF